MLYSNVIHRSLRVWRPLLLLAFIAGFASAAAAFSNDVIPGLLADLRTAQARDLEAVRKSFHNIILGQGTEPNLRSRYDNAIKNVRNQYLTQDPRTKELEKLLAEYGGDPPKLENTGSPPKDVRADIDLAAKDPTTADEVAGKWRQAYGNNAIEELPNGMGYVNHATDTTLWRPCQDQACRDALIKYTDSFGTTGGRNATGVQGNVQDPYGFGLDNQKKFLDALEHGDLKGLAKSVSKAGDASELALTGDDPDFWRQAKALRDYGDPESAGIVRKGMTDAERAQAIKDWEARAQQYMNEAVDELKANGDTLNNWRRAQLDDPNTTPEQKIKLQEEIDRTLADNTKAKAVNREMETRIKSGGNPDALDANGVSPDGNEPATTAGVNDPPTSPEGAPPENTARTTAGAAGDTPTWTASDVRAGARNGMIMAAALTITLCAAQSGLTSDAMEDGRKIAACIEQAVEGMPEAAVLGAVGAMGPYGLGLVTVYSAYQTGKVTLQATRELRAALQAIDQMNQNEAAAASWDAAQANFQRMDTQHFINVMTAIAHRVRGLEADGITFWSACQAARGDPAQAARANALRAKIGTDGPGLVASIRNFAQAFPKNRMFNEIVTGWRGRVGAVVDATARNTSCAQLATASPPGTPPKPAPAPTKPAAAGFDLSGLSGAWTVRNWPGTYNLQGSKGTLSGSFQAVWPDDGKPHAHRDTGQITDCQATGPGTATCKWRASYTDGDKDITRSGTLTVSSTGPDTASMSSTVERVDAESWRVGKYGTGVTKDGSAALTRKR